jgi:opacity protein-like surface antigen
MNAVLLALVFAAGGGDTTSLRAAPVIGMPTAIVNAPADGATRAPQRLPRLSLELRAGGALGEVRAARSTRRPPGTAWSAGAAIRLANEVEATLGYGSSSFGCTDGFCQGRDVRFTGAGADVGVRVSRRAAWIAGGLARHALLARWSTLHAGTGDERAEPAIGWYAGGGAAFEVRDGVLLTPGLRYHAYHTSFGADPADGVGYLTADVGVRVRLR